MGLNLFIMQQQFRNICHLALGIFGKFDKNQKLNSLFLLICLDGKWVMGRNFFFGRVGGGETVLEALHFKEYTIWHAIKISVWK